MSATEQIAVRLLSIAMTAETMSVSKSTVRRLIQSGALKAVRVGDRVMIRPEAIDAYIEGLS